MVGAQDDWAIHESKVLGLVVESLEVQKVHKVERNKEGEEVWKEW